MFPLQYYSDAQKAMKFLPLIAMTITYYLFANQSTANDRHGVRLTLKIHPKPIVDDTLLRLVMLDSY
jgi:hypothetical protein